MLCIISGSRGARESDVVFAINFCPWKKDIKKVVSGTAYGADKFGEKWAEREGLEVIRFPAEWASYGLSAGPRRNKEMSDNADCLIAIWNGTSSGTMSMINYSKKRGLRTMIYFYNEDRFEFYNKSEQLCLL